MASDIEDFEEQLKQEELVQQSENVTEGTELLGVGLRRDADGTLYEFDQEKRAWFPKIDEDFIAKYQLSYGAGSDVAPQPTTDPVAVAADKPSYSVEYWANPPEDINSEEYRIWYEHYCNYFYPSDLPESNDGSQAGVSQGNQSADAGDNAKVQTGSAQDGKKKKKNDKDAPPKPSEPPSWFELDESKNTSVYVKGLPDDITEDEYTDFMTKVGVIAFDPITKKPKLKLYKNPDGSYKGDGCCCYVKAESVGLAMQILDGSNMRGFTVSVERARFELKGEFDPSKRKRKLTKQEKKKSQEKQQKLLGWQPEKVLEGRPKHERVVIIKHAFRPEEIEKDPSLVNELSADFREECKKFGEVRKVVVCDRHVDGVVMVTFRNPEEADACVPVTNGRWFAGQRLEASTWDGRTKYHVEETKEEMEARLAKWHKFIEDSESRSSAAGESADSATKSVTPGDPANTAVEQPPCENNEQSEVTNQDQGNSQETDSSMVCESETVAVSS